MRKKKRRTLSNTFISRENSKADSRYVDMQVSYQDRVWKVVDVQAVEGEENPWLTLRSGYEEVMAKPDEITQLFD